MQHAADLSVVVRVESSDPALGRRIAELRTTAREVVVLDRAGLADVEPSEGVVVLRRSDDGPEPDEEEALRRCSAAWVLWLESGEEPEPALLERVRRLQEGGTLARMGAYRVPVRTVVAGKTLRAGGSAPRSSLRLFRHDGSRFAPRPGTEGIAPPAGAPLGRLSEGITAHPYAGLDRYLRDVDRRLERTFAREGWPEASTPGLLVAWPATFLRHWVLEGGIGDGRAGALWAGARASAAFLRAMRIWVHSRTGERGTTTVAPRSGDRDPAR